MFCGLVGCGFFLEGRLLLWGFGVLFVYFPNTIQFVRDNSQTCPSGLVLCHACVILHF